MIRQATLIDLWDDAPRDVRDAFTDSVELNGNPFYHRWHIAPAHPWDSPERSARLNKVNMWLREQGLTEESVIIITGGW